METIRQQKVQTLILHEIGEYLRIKTEEWAPGMMLTVTRVGISPDLSIAKVYVSIFGKEDHAGVLTVIKEKTKEIRYNLGRKVGKQMRIVPELVFFEDVSLDYIENIDRLLKS